MDTNRKILPSMFAVIAVVSSVLLGAALVGTTLLFQEANAQNATTAMNQTGATAANQTGAAQNQSSILANLTNSDFAPIRENLALVRDAILDNDNVLAYRALGWADNEAFILAGEQGNQSSVLLAQLRPTQDAIQNAQQALLQEDSSTALQELGSAETTLLQITNKLPSEETDETEEDTTEEDTAPPEGGG
jgi:hypothetical protein